MSDMIVRNKQEIEAVLQKAEDTLETGESNFAGMTYEEGMLAFHNWLVGNCDENPFDV